MEDKGYSNKDGFLSKSGTTRGKLAAKLQQKKKKKKPTTLFTKTR